MKAVYAVFFLFSVSSVIGDNDYKQALKDSFKNCTQKYHVQKPTSVSGADLNGYLQFAKSNPSVIACFYDCVFRGAGLAGDSGFDAESLKTDLEVGKSSAMACVFPGEDVAKCGEQANTVQLSDPTDPKCERTQEFVKCLTNVKCNVM
ncbi:uncharacterized protein LOC134546271 [Bacillus rossius redtenbacheri]|uniref:uncharacterized protein LOC134546271 n=1 Tax=Bacillus rossius redtenbacheri TaxID=93214 RepID=UPI002FDD2FE4